MAGLWVERGGISASEMQAGCCMEPGPCPARAPSQTIKGAPSPLTSEFKLRRGARIRAISGISCRRGNLKSRRLSRATLPHGGPRGRRGKSTAPACIVLGTCVQCCFSQPTEPPPAASPGPSAQLPALHMDSRGLLRGCLALQGGFLRS